MIALVHCGDLKNSPYMRRYIERLELLNVDFKVYFWNREGLNYDLSEKYVVFNHNSRLSKSKKSKFFDFLKFRHWLIKKLKKDNPQKLIVLTTLTGIILSGYLRKSKKDYIFDIRDYTYEYIRFFYRIEKSVIENSKFVTISSRGFESFLPKHKYVISHNFNRNDIVQGKHFEKKTGKIRFVWNGLVRYFQFQKQYLDALKNDERFEIVYHGDGPELERFKKYCNENDIRNVVFTGAYNNKDKAHLLHNAHILNNAYGFMEKGLCQNRVKYAVSNKFYDGMIYHIPQIVEPDGFKSDWIRDCQIGECFSPDKFFADKLYNYYTSIVPEKFDAKCESLLQTVLKEDDEYITMIDEFISK